MPKPSHDPQLELPLAHASDSATDARGDQPTFAFEFSFPVCPARRLKGRGLHKRPEHGELATLATREMRQPAVEPASSRRRPRARVLPLPPLPREWREDVRVPYLGEMLRVRLAATNDICVVDNELHLPQPPHADARQIRDCVHAWLQREAQIVLGDIVAACNAAVRWSLLHSKTDLHFVDANGELRLNWRLVLISRAEIVRIVARACRSGNESHAKNLQADLLGTDHS